MFKMPVITIDAVARCCSAAALCLSALPLMAAKPDPYQDIINRHYVQYVDQEFFSAIQVSIKGGDKRQDYAVGKTERDKSAPQINTQHLFEIGSISKSFTAVLALKAEEQGLLSLDDRLSEQLPHYAHWGSIRVSQLLNMTSGLPNYSDSPTMNYRFAHNPEYVWATSEIIDLVYSKQFSPPLTTGYEYTNTGYVLLDMILAQTTKKSYATLLLEQIFQPLQLKNSFYPVPAVSPAVAKRLIAGYGYNVYTNPELLGRNMKANNLSWGGAAGGIVANSADVVRWVEALFIGDRLLTPAQKTKMQQMVSTETGEAIKQTDAEHPRGFALGIIQSYDPEIGRFWFYEGETLGFRSFYMYVPCNQVIISALFNSATNAENDHGGELILALYQQVLKENSALRSCSRAGD
ncbi:MAG: beta-lactamase family protein [Legionellaceae bacterium]|nr:beta-lactamase family protein [Legionellaceae bacterium]